ncbi:MAG: hypothetical protein ACKVGW_00390 [Verrucomicrobiia bacterium]|jgi:hypothetical protein
MEKASLYARYVLALALLIFGINKFAGFMPMPEYAPGSAPMNYMIGLTGVHMFPILGIIYLASAILLATNKLVGLVTVILSAIVFNILLFHITLDPAGLPPSIVVAVLLVLVMIGNKDKYQALLK